MSDTSPKNDVEEPQSTQGKPKSKLHTRRVIILIVAIVVGAILAKVLGENSAWLLAATALVTIISLGVSNLFQVNKEFHYKDTTLLVAAYVSGGTLGIAIMQIDAVLRAL